MFGLTRGKTSRLISVWSGFTPDHVVGLAWTSDSRTLAAAAGTGPVTWFAAATGGVRGEVRAHKIGTTAIVFQPGSELLATAGMDGFARLWHPQTDVPVAELDGGGADWVERLAWRADGSRLAIAAGRKVRVWDARGGHRADLNDHPSTVSDLAWQPGSNTLTALVYGGVVLWTLSDDGPPTCRQFTWKGSPLRMAWSPNGRMLAHGNQDATVHFWYAETGEDLQMWGYPMKVQELSWDHSSRFLATGGGHMVCIWDCGGNGPQNTEPQMLEGHSPSTRLATVQYQRGGRLLASAGADGRVCVWHPSDKKQPLVGAADTTGEAATCAVWSPDDKFLGVGFESGRVSVFRIG